MREGGVKGKKKDQSDQKGKMLARQSAVERECERGRRGRTGKKEAQKERGDKKRKQRSIVSSGGRLAGFHTGDAIESDTSTQHSCNTLALILISVFLVGG